MKRRVRPWSLLFGLASTLAGCNYAPTTPPPRAITPTTTGSSSTVGETSDEGPTSTYSSTAGESDSQMKPVIIKSVINLIQTAALKPGGDNFKQATAKLNNYFEGTPRQDYQLKPASREFLAKQLSPDTLTSFESSSFEMPDARHLEDCMLYHGIAIRIGGNGDDLTRVRRLFDWTIRQVQLIPPNSLAVPGIGQAQARPYDVLLRGLATEAGGYWSERGWLFMSLCRQLGIDVGLLTYTPAGEKDPVPWICGVLIDQKIYLFDARIGIAIPKADGTGVATLDEALADPRVLNRLDLPGQSPYRVTGEQLNGSPSKIGIAIDSSPGYLSPRMYLLQESLVGKNRTVLFRDAAEQRDQFVKALGAHAGEVVLWPMPITVLNRLFTDARFVQATQVALHLYDSKYPLLYARIKQLRGEMAEAVNDYMNFRIDENPLQMDGVTKITPEEQEALHHHATYFLALCHLEQNNAKQAAFFFGESLRFLQAPGPGQTYYNMFRWGAATNLAYLHEAKGELSQAIAYYSESNPTPQYHGNLVLARELVWQNPMARPPVPLPPPPAASASEPEPAPASAPIDVLNPANRPF